MLRYKIFRTRLAGKERYLGRLSPLGVLKQADLVTAMADLGTSVSREDIESALDLLKKSLTKLCGLGFIVHLDDLVRFVPVLGGEFADAQDSFQAGRNTLFVNSIVSKAFNKEFERLATIEKLASVEYTPTIMNVKDLVTKTNNDTVTKGDIVSLGGERLKFDPLNPTDYLRFVNASDPTQFVPITLFQTLTDKEAVFKMPDVAWPSGYFEMSNCLNTTKARIGKSDPVSVA